MEIFDNFNVGSYMCIVRFFLHFKRMMCVNNKTLLK